MGRPLEKNYLQGLNLNVKLQKAVVIENEQPEVTVAQLLKQVGYNKYSIVSEAEQAKGVKDVVVTLKKELKEEGDAQLALQKNQEPVMYITKLTKRLFYTSEGLKFAYSYNEEDGFNFADASIHPVIPAEDGGVAVQAQALKAEAPAPKAEVKEEAPAKAEPKTAKASAKK